jgi:hypothetical protein
MGVSRISCCLAVLLAACAANYGRLQRSETVGRIFERHEVLADHAYFTTGSEAQPTAILAIQHAYTLKTELWRPVEMTPDRLKRLVDAMTNQLGFAPVIMGGRIVDPAGKPVGLWYSRESSPTIRFEPDNIIVVSPPTPDRERHPAPRHHPFG